MLTLYDYFRSSACYRVRIALYFKNLPFDIIPIHLVNHGGEQHSSDYQKINPQSFVPSLQVDNTILTQSLAIIEYLEERYPHPALLPKDMLERALIRSFALTIAADIHPLNNLRVLKYLANDLKVSDEQKTDWYQHWMKKGLSSLEARLQALALSGDFCFGDAPTLADLCLVPQMYNARRFACDTHDYPTLVRIDANCQKLAAFMKAKPPETETV